MSESWISDLALQVIWELFLHTLDDNLHQSRVPLLHTKQWNTRGKSLFNKTHSHSSMRIQSLDRVRIL